MTRPTEPTDLGALAALLDGATPGPWRCTDWPWKDRPAQQMGDYTSERSVMSIPLKVPVDFHRKRDADFVAHLRNAAPGLIAEVAELRRKVEAVEEILDEAELDRPYMVYAAALRAALETA